MTLNGWLVIERECRDLCGDVHARHRGQGDLSSCVLASELCFQQGSAQCDVERRVTERLRQRNACESNTCEGARQRWSSTGGERWCGKRSYVNGV
jgi:hypothetical protein